MTARVGSPGTWLSKVRSLWIFSIIIRSKEKGSDIITAEEAAITPIAAPAMDPAARDHRFEASAPQESYPPITRLPTELLLCIFHHDFPGISRRLELTHVCRHWQAIAIASGSLWTSIKITPSPDILDEDFRKFISLLDLQLERSQVFPLDVVWHLCGRREHISVIIDHIRLKGHFSRWRSLTLSITSSYQPPILPTDSFSNLECLVVLSVDPHAILRAINVTTTHKLRTLDIGLSGTRDEDVGILYGAMLKHVSRLVLASPTSGETVNRLPPIPATITDIEAEQRRNHPFPHVKTYKLRNAIFRAGNTFDLQALTTLIVTNDFIVRKDCRVILPSLRRFVCARLLLGHESVLDAPQLDELAFLNNSSNNGPARTRYNYLKNLLDHPGFLLSPANSLAIEPPLQGDVIIKMVERYARLETLELRFNNDVTVWKVTVAIGGKVDGNTAICPRLSELRLRIAPEYGSRHRVEWWKDRAAQIVHGRKGCAASLRIYGALYGVETFTRLA